MNLLKWSWHIVFPERLPRPTIDLNQATIEHEEHEHAMKDYDQWSYDMKRRLDLVKRGLNMRKRT